MRPHEATFRFVTTPSGRVARPVLESPRSIADGVPMALRPRWRVLRAVQAGATSVTAIAAIVGLDKRATSRLLVQLQRAELVRQETRGCWHPET